MKKIAFVLFTIVLLFGCGKPLPEDKSAYAGHWQSKEMSLLILQDGTIAYERLKHGGSTSVKGPIKEFVGDDFVVGFAFLTTTFDVTQPPVFSSGQWIMVVDGVTLVKREH